MANRVARRDLAKERHWRELTAKQRASELSVREFCANAGVAENSFYAWRRELAVRDAEAAGGTAGEPKKTAGEPQQRKSVHRHPQRRSATSSADAATFVPVALSNLPGAAAVEVALPSGVTLRVAAGCDEATLRSVLSALEPLSC